MEKMLKSVLAFLIASAIMLFMIPNLSESYFPSYINPTHALFLIVIMDFLLFIFIFRYLFKK